MSVSPLPASLDHQHLAAQFDYDASTPLDPTEERAAVQSSGVMLHDVSYASGTGGRVPAWLVTPGTIGRGPAIVFLHPSNTGRDWFLPEMVSICATAGAICVAITAVHARPGHQPFATFTPVDREQVIQTVIDLRRAVDLLATRSDVDAGRIGFVGLSYGADYGAVFCGVEHRLRACALVSGGTLRDYYRSHAPAAMRDEFLQLMRYVDPAHFLPHVAPAALLFQNATQDRIYTRQEISDFQNAGSEPKVVKMYEEDHFLGETARNDRRAWLGGQLRF